MKIELFIPSDESELVNFDMLRAVFNGETEVDILHARNIAPNELAIVIEALGYVKACVNEHGTVILSATCM